MSSDAVLVVIGCAVALVLLWLMFQKWFWLLVVGLGIVASGFTVLASIIHFQIVSAMGFFVLASVLAGLFYVIADA